MAAKREFGHSEIETVNILPALAFDMLEGRALSEKFGKTEIPVEPLPGLPFDMCAPSVPVLNVTLHFRTGATPGEVARDLHHLSAALHRLDLSHGGSGLVPEESAHGGAEGNGSVRVAYRATDPVNALERLRQLAAAINEVENGRSIEKCHACITQHAA